MSPRLSAVFRFMPIVLLAVSLLGACAALPTEDSGVDTLRERAQAYWEARVANDPLTAARYEEPAAEGGDQLGVRRPGGVRYLSAEVGDVRILADDRAEVDVRVRYTILALTSRRPIEADLVTQWILREGRWYHRSNPSQ